MEAWSIEDNGDGICFNVFCYNVQPRITIDYSNGDNWESNKQNDNNEASQGETYILNTKSIQILKDWLEYKQKQKLQQEHLQ